MEVLEVLVTTAAFLLVGGLIGILGYFRQKANAENDENETKSNAENAEPMKAIILCNGHMDENPDLYDYKGEMDCRAALSIGNGGKICSTGCIGLGSCVSICPEDAIAVRKGLAKVNLFRCNGCGLCLNVCPKNLIVLRPQAEVIGHNCKNGCPEGECKACEGVTEN